jgi:hypothetical protein
VQQLIGFVQEELLRTGSIKRKEKKQDGRNDIKALRAHYGEEVSDKVRWESRCASMRKKEEKQERCLSRNS